MPHLRNSEDGVVPLASPSGHASFQAYISLELCEAVERDVVRVLRQHDFYCVHLVRCTPFPRGRGEGGFVPSAANRWKVPFCERNASSCAASMESALRRRIVKRCMRSGAVYVGSNLQICHGTFRVNLCHHLLGQVWDLLKMSLFFAWDGSLLS